MSISKTCIYTVSRYETWIFVMYKSCFTGQNGSNIADNRYIIIVYIRKTYPYFLNF